MAKQGRFTVYNDITGDKLKLVNKRNLQLEDDFIEYLESLNRADSTIYQYRSNLHIFWVWNYEYNKDKFFVNLTKRDLIHFQSHALKEWGWSPKRYRTVKSTLSSLSDYIENILDDEFVGYHSIINKLGTVENEPVRTKTVITDEELQFFLDYFTEQGDHMRACMIALAAYSGKRKSELPRFKVSYFDKENLICEGALYRTPETITTKGRGKQGKQLIAYTLAKPFQPYFDAWMKQREEIGIESQWLFPRNLKANYNGEDLPANVTMIDSCVIMLNKVFDKPVYMHAFRHYFVTSLSRQGIPDDVIKMITGWTNVSMVGVYKDIDESEELEKYFGAEGIKKVESKTLSDL